MKKNSLMLLACIYTDSINDIIHLICLLIAEHYGVLHYF
ncbi:Uncharacterised protein [Enterobacter hormaechei]|nr:Uncharacterised protein [Enterobacter hormaechei]